MRRTTTWHRWRSPAGNTWRGSKRSMRTRWRTAMGSPIAVADNVNWSVMKKVVVGNDLSDLSDQEIVTYYRSLCESLGLNPLTRPFQLIRLNGKLTLYA